MQEKLVCDQRGLYLHKQSATSIPVLAFFSFIVTYRRPYLVLFVFLLQRGTSLFSPYCILVQKLIVFMLYFSRDGYQYCIVVYHVKTVLFM